MSKEDKVKGIVFTLITIFGVAGSLISVAIGMFLSIKYAVSVDKPSDISVIASVLAVMTFIAVSNLDRYLKLRHLDIQSERTRVLIEERIVKQIRADAFFKDRLNIDESIFATASSIAVSGITLGNTVRAFVDIFGRRLIAGAKIRIIVVETDEPTLNQLVRRSFGQPVPTTDYYRKRIESTLTLIQIIAGVTNATGTLQVGFLPYIPSFGITIIDQDTSNGKAFIEVYYHNSEKTPPQFELTASKDPLWFHSFAEQFELMWSQCDVRQILVDGKLQSNHS